MAGSKGLLEEIIGFDILNVFVVQRKGAYFVG